MIFNEEKGMHELTDEERQSICGEPRTTRAGLEKINDALRAENKRLREACGKAAVVLRFAARAAKGTDTYWAEIETDTAFDLADKLYAALNPKEGE